MFVLNTTNNGIHPLYCFHCTGNHSPTSKECPRNKFEQEVKDVAQNQHISIGSAKWQIMAANRSSTSSYAQAIKQMKSDFQSKHTPLSGNCSQHGLGAEDSAPVPEAHNSSSIAYGNGLVTPVNVSEETTDADVSDMVGAISDSLPSLESGKISEEDENQLITLKKICY